jgi:phage terminase Nu1 subunit (DNA packaging protein)
MTAKPISGELAVSVARAAQLFDVTEKTVRSWIRAGLPTLKKGGKGAGNAAIIDLADLIPWYLEENALDVAKTRLASAQADKHEMENDLRRGELLEVAGVEAEWTDLVTAFRAKMLSMPGKLGPQLTNVSDASIIAARLRAEVFAALAELAVDEAEGPRKATRRARPGPAASRAAAVADGERVGRRVSSTQ